MKTVSGAFLRFSSPRTHADRLRCPVFLFHAEDVESTLLVESTGFADLLRRTKSRADVVELLGEPPPTVYFADWDLVYWLGPERGFFSIDSEGLVLRLGEDGRVVENRIVRD